MKTKSVILLLIVAFLLSACGASETGTPTVDVNQLYTAAAETVIAELTQTAAASTPTEKATATSTPVPEEATQVPTSVIVTETPSITETPTPQPTIIVETSPTDQFCDNAVWVGDVSVQDGTEMSPGQSFEKTWRIRNTGTCTWGSGYNLVFGYGEGMNGQARALDKIVSPEDTIEVTVVFTAPLTTGSYQSYWRMANTAGANFGEFFYVDIVVR
ncbi:MAG: hypothetical protein HN855_09030 [Anaerolineae bacterium]|jgi:hypothetical protein|nr:hypothetical protein [Anaerolineae bacterium]MBT7073009.1 hypothetical protein [Anaerolineae bacterium]MBT7325289.1 hypothetical protein [Anaerolineae bacterium]